MGWSDDNTMCFRWTTDCTNSSDDYIIFKMNLRGHFDYKIGWLLLYCRIYRRTNVCEGLTKKFYGLGY